MVDASLGKVTITLDLDELYSAINQLSISLLELHEAMGSREQAIYNVINKPWIKDNWTRLSHSRWSWQIRELRQNLEDRQHEQWSKSLVSQGKVRNNA